MKNLTLLSETLLDNYRITIDMKKECTRLFLGLASSLIPRNAFGLQDVSSHSYIELLNTRTYMNSQILILSQAQACILHCPRTAGLF